MMSRLTDRNYHESRAREELQRAEESLDPGIASIHRELATLHKRRMMAIVEESMQPELAIGA